MPVDSNEALRRATLVRSDPSLDGVTRQKKDLDSEAHEWQYFTPNGEVVEEEEKRKRSVRSRVRSRHGLEWGLIFRGLSLTDLWKCP